VRRRSAHALPFNTYSFDTQYELPAQMTVDFRDQGARAADVRLVIPALHLANVPIHSSVGVFFPTPDGTASYNACS